MKEMDIISKDFTAGLNLSERKRAKSRLKYVLLFFHAVIIEEHHTKYETVQSCTSLNVFLLRVSVHFRNAHKKV